MNNFFKVLLGNLVLNKGPQDFPFSTVLMRLSLMLYFVTGLPGLMTNISFETAVLAMSLDVVVLLLFTYACLQAFSKTERYVQTIISLASIGTVFQLLVLPLLFNTDINPEESQTMISLSILLLIFVSWNLAVYAHVFRESFGVRLPAAMALTICFILVTLLARKILFPDLG